MTLTSDRAPGSLNEFFINEFLLNMLIIIYYDKLLHDNWNNTGVIPDIPADQRLVNNFGEPLEENEEPHQILIDENVINVNGIEVRKHV